MKKLALVLLVALGIGGCAQLQALTGAISLSSTTYSNPVTLDKLYAAENSMIVAFAALGAYKQACSQGVADVNCKANVRKIQAYTRQLPPMLSQVRAFVKNNDQINAVIVYNEVVSLVTNLKSAAVAAGVPMGGL
jgi:hypothetical protein